MKIGTERWVKGQNMFWFQKHATTYHKECEIIARHLYKLSKYARTNIYSLFYNIFYDIRGWSYCLRNICYSKTHNLKQ